MPKQWYPQSEWYYETPAKGKGKAFSTPKKPKKPTQPTEEGMVMRGYDGRKIVVATSGSTSQQSSSSSSAASQEVVTLKNMIKQLASGQPLTEEQSRYLDSGTDPREQLRAEQRDLNLRRRRQNKLKSLEDKMEDNENKYQTWMNAQRQVVKDEKARYKDEQEKLQQALEELNKEETMEVEQPEDESEDDELFKVRDKDDMVHRRLLQAERQAADAQAAMLMIQSQLQQIFAYNASTATAPPMMPTTPPGQMVDPAVTPLGPRTHPSKATTPPLGHGGRSSPVLPKGVKQNIHKPKGTTQDRREPVGKSLEKLKEKAQAVPETVEDAPQVISEDEAEKSDL